jgi:hypothetical protein
MELLNEVKRVTGWKTLFEHQGFFILLAAISSTLILWFYPGMDRILDGYLPQTVRAASVIRAVEPLSVSVSEVVVYPQEELSSDETLPL